MVEDGRLAAFPMAQSIIDTIILGTGPNPALVRERERCAENNSSKAEVQSTALESKLGPKDIHSRMLLTEGFATQCVEWRHRRMAGWRYHVASTPLRWGESPKPSGTPQGIGVIFSSEMGSMFGMFISYPPFPEALIALTRILAQGASS